MSELEQAAGQVKNQTRKSCLFYLAILLLGISILVYIIMKTSYASEAILFFLFIATMIVIKSLLIIKLPSGILKIMNSAFLFLGFIIILLVISTILTEFYLHPPKYEPMPIGILHRYGIQIEYAILTSALLFVIVIILNRRNTWGRPMIFAVIGLLGLTPFVILYLLLIFWGLTSFFGL